MDQEKGNLHQITVATQKKREVMEITPEIDRLLQKENSAEGFCCLFVAQNQAALITAPLDAEADLNVAGVREIITPELTSPKKEREHDRPIPLTEDVIASLFGPFLVLPFREHRLVLGRGQGVFLVEMNGPREHKIILSFK